MTPTFGFSVVRNRFEFSDECKMRCHVWRQYSSTASILIFLSLNETTLLDPDRATTRFKGRQDLFNQIETLALSSPPPILLLYGGRRIGKTSSLRYLPQKMGSDIIPLFVDMQGLQADDPRNFVTALAQAIQTSARTTRNYNLPPIDAEAVRRDPFPALQQWFTEIEQVIDRAKRILLCLDEFERLDRIFAGDQIHAPLNFFRNVMQHRQRWIVLFSGSTHPDDLQSHWNDCLINARSLLVSYLDDAAARELIRQPIPDFPDIYDPAAVERILHLTRC
ncbi:MAG: AAA family ATPase [Spirulina sp. SIO3F2]|nr:AAA family ATPase [Spirulina sp. SIO3F2]